MKQKFFSPKRFFLTFVWTTVFFLCSIFLISGCDSNQKGSGALGTTLTKPGSDTTKDWIVLNVTFKPNTSKEMRETSAKAIEELLMDTVNAMRKKGYSNYSPDICIKKNPIKEPLTYHFTVTSYSLSDTIPPPTCTCANRCKICSYLATYSPGSPYEAIESFSTGNILKE